MGHMSALTTAVIVLVSQYDGAREIELVKRTVGDTLLILILASAALSTLGMILVRPLPGLINTPPEL